MPWAHYIRPSLVMREYTRINQVRLMASFSSLTCDLCIFFSSFLVPVSSYLGLVFNLLVYVPWFKLKSKCRTVEPVT